MRRTHGQVAAEAVARDRAAAVAYAADYCRQVDALCAKGRVAPDEGELLKERITAFAGAIGQGLHV
jgi:hypothetical protein